MSIFFRKKIKNFVNININSYFFQLLLKKIVSNNYYSFCYHEVTNTPSKFQKEYDLFVSLDNFDYQIQFLKQLFKGNHKNNLLNQNFLVTFDDGYKGSFNHGLNICKKNSIKPIFFLNMYSIIYQKPLLSAIVIYLKKYSKEFTQYCEFKNIKQPEYIYIDPNKFSDFIKSYKIDNDKIEEFQGELIQFEDVKNYDNSNDLYFASHLYDHYNVKSLNNFHLELFINENEKVLNKFNSHLRYFAFPNGQPKTCFTKKNIKYLESKFDKIFSSFGSSYNNQFLTDRIVLTNDDDHEDKIKSKIITSYIKKFLYIKNLHL